MSRNLRLIALCAGLLAADGCSDQRRQLKWASSAASSLVGGELLDGVSWWQHRRANP
jgi:hypothetical protein